MDKSIAMAFEKAAPIDRQSISFWSIPNSLFSLLQWWENERTFLIKSHGPNCSPSIHAKHTFRVWLINVSIASPCCCQEKIASQKNFRPKYIHLQLVTVPFENVNKANPQMGKLRETKQKQNKQYVLGWCIVCARTISNRLTVPDIDIASLCTRPFRFLVLSSLAVWRNVSLSRVACVRACVPCKAKMGESERALIHSKHSSLDKTRHHYIIAAIHACECMDPFIGRQSARYIIERNVCMILLWRCHVH